LEKIFGLFSVGSSSLTIRLRAGAFSTFAVGPGAFSLEINRNTHTDKIAATGKERRFRADIIAEHVVEACIGAAAKLYIRGPPKDISTSPHSLPKYCINTTY